MNKRYEHKPKSCFICQNQVYTYEHDGIYLCEPCYSGSPESLFYWEAFNEYLKGQAKSSRNAPRTPDLPLGRTQTLKT